MKASDKKWITIMDNDLKERVSNKVENNIFINQNHKGTLISRDFKT